MSRAAFILFYTALAYDLLRCNLKKSPTMKTLLLVLTLLFLANSSFA